MVIQPEYKLSCRSQKQSELSLKVSHFSKLVFSTNSKSNMKKSQITSDEHKSDEIVHKILNPRSYKMQGFLHEHDKLSKFLRLLLFSVQLGVTT
jgi:hypothetical protein